MAITTRPPSSASLTRVLREFARTLVREFDLTDVLDELATHTVDILDATGVGVSVCVGDDRLRFVTATSALVVGIEEQQDEHQYGPCVEAFRSGEIVAVGNLGDLDRWPEYRAAAEQVGVSSVAGIPMVVDGLRLGALDVYDVSERAWSDDNLDAARVLADIATVYVVRAGELAEARELTGQLQHALDSRVVIEQAKGMVARDLDVDVDAAFTSLRRHARSNHRRLREVAAAVVDGTLRIPR